MAEQQNCIGIKTDGQRCTRRVTHEQRCRMHHDIREDNGPNFTAMKELDYTHKRLARELTARWNQTINNEADNDRKIIHRADMDHELNILKINQRREKVLLARQQDEEIQRTGIDPDAPARARREERWRQQREDFQFAMRQQEQERQIAAAELAAQENRLGDVRAIAVAQFRQVMGLVNQPVVQRDDELARFARDGQNVHTTRAVQQTKEMVDKLLRIPVPEGYRWNMNECSKTPGEIIVTCKLTPKAAWQMSAKYCQDETIYELGRGIYGRVLDGVWQYITKSESKEDLCKSLKQEMEDNIGMCAQGNLSRLCNILAGYMEGIGGQESPTEILGRLMPKLMEIDNIEERLDRAYKIFEEVKLPEEEWQDWLDPLVDDETKRVCFMKNEAGITTSLKLVNV